ncbi:MAG: nucleotidyl transferase AbiEii/AbiGii toxin family protein [Candidatus Uhrbacteria bacterium]
MLDAATHKKVLLQILADIYANKEIGPFLGFKGGTAAYLFYGLDRFSVDLDFDLLDKSKEEVVFSAVEKIIKKYGLIKEAAKKKSGFLFVLSYDQKINKAQNVKIEINRREFGSKFELKSYMGISTLVMIKEDMFAHKLVAMSERLGKTNRDIYDVCFFAKNNWPINKAIVENRADVSFKKFLRKVISNLKIYQDKNILDGLGDLVTEKQKVWIRTKLKNETLFLLKLMLDGENKK